MPENPGLGEDAHEGAFFEGEIEARGAGVALAVGASAQLVVDAAALVAFGAKDMETARLDDFVVVFSGVGGVGGEGLVPVRLVSFELLPLVIEAQQAGGGHGIDGALSGADGANEVLLDEIALGEEFGVAAVQDVGAAAGHVGGDGDLGELSGLGDNLGFALVEFGVEDDVLDAFALENVGEQLGFFNRRGADQHQAASIH